MNLKNHDIGKIAGCLVIAVGVRELFTFVVHLILREEYGDVGFLFVLGIALGIGLYCHWLPEYGLLLLIACLGEIFVITAAIEVPIKIGLGKLSFPTTIFSFNIESYGELYAFLTVCALLLAIPIYFLLTSKAREEYNYSKWVHLAKRRSD